MTTQYTIISVLVRQEIQEKISLGILLYNSEDVLFKYSRNKLQISKELIPASSNRLLKATIKNIEDQISKNYAYKDKDTLTLFEKSFNSSYLSYLSKYSNNIISFSTPKEISMPFDQQTLDILYSKYVDLNDDMTSDKLTTFDIVKSKHKEKIFQHYNIEKEINHLDVPNLITPVKIDFSGHNEISVFVQTLDMEQNYNHISNHINSFLQLKIAYEKSKTHMKDYLIAQEPKKKFAKQHDIWSQLNLLKTFDLLDVSESEKIIEYAELHDVKPL